MKRLLPLLFTVVLFSCKKKDDGQHCYTCHITGGIPYEHRTLDTCSGEVASDKYHFQDANGNTQDFLCEEK